MKCSKLFDKIDELYEEYLSVWCDVCNLESPTWYKKGVDEVGRYFAGMAEKRGWGVEILAQEKAGNPVCITMNPKAGGQMITLSGHIDTVHEVGSFGTPAVHCDENNIYGPGVMDCKGGVVAAFLAMDALFQCGFDKRPVQLLMQTDEECNSRLSGKATINYMCQKAKNSIAFLNCESSRNQSAVLSRKGILRFCFVVEGKEIHSSRCPEGASAIAEAANKILKLETLKDADGLTCNCGMIRGGTADNTVSQTCEFTADIRFSTKKEMEWAKDFVKEIAGNSTIEGCTCKLEQTGYRPAMEQTEINMELLGKMNRIYEENGLPVLTVRKSLGGSDAAEITECKIPCVDSIGVEGDYIHTVNEYAVLKSLAFAAKRIASVVYCI